MPPNPDSIRACAESHILLRKTDQEVLDSVRRAFPGCQTSIGSIRVYRCRLRRTRPDVPSQVRVRFERREEREALA